MDLKIIVFALFLVLIAALCFETPIVMKYLNQEVITITEGNQLQIYSVGDKTFACNINQCTAKCLDVIIIKRS
jgi:hypothetical protein